MSGEVRNVKLPEELCARVESRYGRQFASMEELLTFVLNELLCETPVQLNQAEERIIEERLRELGYV